MKKMLKSTVPLQILALLAAGCSVAPEEDARQAERRLPARDVQVARSVQDPVDLTFDATAVQPVSMSEAVAAASDLDPGADHATLGKEAWKAGEFTTAARHLRYAVENDQADPYEVYLLGLSLWHANQAEEAEYFLVDACWKMENFVRAPVNLARVRIELGNLSGARKSIDEALAMDPDFGPAYNVLGRIHMAESRRDEAAEAYRRAAELDPENPWPLNNLGYSLLVAGDAKRAVDPLSQAVERNDGHACIWNNLALAREQSGDLDGALTAAQMAATLEETRADYEATVTRIAALVPEPVSVESTAVAEASTEIGIIEEEAAALDSVATEGTASEETETAITTLP